MLFLGPNHFSTFFAASACSCCPLRAIVSFWARVSSLLVLNPQSYRYPSLGKLFSSPTYSENRVAVFSSRTNYRLDMLDLWSHDE
jgi:hypothetical protein